MEATLLNWGLVAMAVVQVVLVGLRLGARGRRLGRALDRLPAHSVYEEEDADGSVLRVKFGAEPAASPCESTADGRDA